MWWKKKKKKSSSFHLHHFKNQNKFFACSRLPFIRFLIRWLTKNLKWKPHKFYNNVHSRWQELFATFQNFLLYSSSTQFLCCCLLHNLHRAKYNNCKQHDIKVVPSPLSLLLLRANEPTNQPTIQLLPKPTNTGGVVLQILVLVWIVWQIIKAGRDIRAFHTIYFSVACPVVSFIYYFHNNQGTSAQVQDRTEQGREWELNRDSGAKGWQ